MSSVLGQLGEWIAQVMEALGYAGVVLLMFLENVFPPIPSELIMPLAGFTAATGSFNIWLVIAAGTLGTVLGALPLYAVGRVMSTERLHAMLLRYPWLMVKPSDVDKAQAWFDRYGYALIFFGRMVPGIRSLISIPAGMSAMPLLPFIALTTLGSALWSGALAFAGFYLGANYDALEPIIGTVSRVILVACIGFGALFFFKRVFDFIQSKRAQAR